MVVSKRSDKVKSSTCVVAFADASVLAATPAAQLQHGLDVIIVARHDDAIEENLHRNTLDCWLDVEARGRRDISGVLTTDGRQGQHELCACRVR